MPGAVAGITSEWGNIVRIQHKRSPADRQSRPGLLVALLVPFLIFAGALPASADSSAYSSDNGAYGEFTSQGERFFLDDIKCDNSSVYITYNVGSGSNQRFENTQGCNTPGLTLNLSVAEGTDVDWQVCTNIQLAPDNCSPWIDDQALFDR